ncbi:MAG: hypothetical protein LIP77_04645, partial [Planctomycetes bacterium]|nr:hypothetical protein [Planctomycetota bacterium]
MRGLSLFLLLLFLTVTAATQASAAQVVSSTRNVGAVMEARGFRIAPVANAMVGYSPRDLAPVQAFEIVRPQGEKITIGRLYTSCGCVQLESPKRTFERGERAVLELHNVIPTPPDGQNYAIYVQITSPIRATLRYDTFVKSTQFASTLPLDMPDPEIEILVRNSDDEDLNTAAGGVQEEDKAAAAQAEAKRAFESNVATTAPVSDKYAPLPTDKYAALNSADDSAAAEADHPSDPAAASVSTLDVADGNSDQQTATDH